MDLEDCRSERDTLKRKVTPQSENVIPRLGIGREIGGFYLQIGGIFTNN